MDENAHRSWDIRLRTAGVVALIAAGVFGLWKYSTDLSASFKQPFYIQQMDTYMEMAKVVSNIEEVRARGGRIIAVATEGDQDIHKYADEVFFVPPVSDPLQPLLTVVPLQLLAYHAASLKGHDVDKPRNLAKSVTVE